MIFMAILIEFDAFLFRLVNNLWHPSFLNHFFSFFSLLGSWGAVWLLIAACLVIWEELEDKRGLWTLILAILLCVVAGDLVIKNLVARPRPEFALAGVTVIGDARRSYSFPSGHTAIAFAAALVLSKEHRRWKYGYYLVAILIAASRVYLGKHYPLDVLGGALLGTGIGYISLYITGNIKFKI